MNQKQFEQKLQLRLDAVASKGMEDIMKQYNKEVSARETGKVYPMKKAVWPRALAAVAACAIIVAGIALWTQLDNPNPVAPGTTAPSGVNTTAAPTTTKKDDPTDATGGGDPEHPPVSVENRLAWPKEGRTFNVYKLQPDNAKETFLQQYLQQELDISQQSLDGNLAAGLFHYNGMSDTGDEAPFSTAMAAETKQRAEKIATDLAQITGQLRLVLDSTQEETVPSYRYDFAPQNASAVQGHPVEERLFIAFDSHGKIVEIMNSVSIAPRVLWKTLAVSEADIQKALENLNFITENETAVVTRYSVEYMATWQGDDAVVAPSIGIHYRDAQGKYQERGIGFAWAAIGETKDIPQ